MSRRHQLMRTPLTLVTLIITCGVVGLALTGCGAGQVTQTDSQVAVIDGVDGDIGNIALRDVLIPYPDDGHGSHLVGSNVPLHFTIVNQANIADKLVSVTSPVAGRVQLEGTTIIPAGRSIISADRTGSDRTASNSTPSDHDSTASDHDTDSEGSPSPTPSLQPAKPLDFGELRIVLLDINRELSPGLNTQVTFVFRDAGTVTLPVPMGLPLDSERKPLHEGGHS